MRHAVGHTEGGPKDIAACGGTAAYCSRLCVSAYEDRAVTVRIRKTCHRRRAMSVDSNGVPKPSRTEDPDSEDVERASALEEVSPTCATSKRIQETCHAVSMDSNEVPKASRCEDPCSECVPLPS